MNINDKVICIMKEFRQPNGIGVIKKIIVTQNNETTFLVDFDGRLVVLLSDQVQKINY